MFKQDHVRRCLQHFVSQANKNSFNHFVFLEDDKWFSVVSERLFISSVLVSRLPDYLLRFMSISLHGDNLYLRFEKSEFPIS